MNTNENTSYCSSVPAIYERDERENSPVFLVLLLRSRSDGHTVPGEGRYMFSSSSWVYDCIVVVATVVKDAAAAPLAS